VSVSIAHQHVEDDDIQEVIGISGGLDGEGANKVETLRQIRAALTLVFEDGGDAKGLAEVLLVQSFHAAFGT